MMSFKKWIAEYVSLDEPQVEKPLARGPGALPTYDDEESPPTPGNNWGRRPEQTPSADKLLGKWMKRKMKKK